MKTIAIIGGGTGGVAVANRLYRNLKEEVERNLVKIVLFDKKDYHVFYPGLLFYSLGLLNEEDILVKNIKDLIRPGIELKIEEVTEVNLDDRKIISANKKEYSYDYLVISTGVEYNWARIPGLRENMLTFYELDGARKIRNSFQNIKEGTTIVINVTKIPYPCIPVPMSFAILLKDLFKDRVNVIYTAPVAPEDFIEEIFSKKGIEDRSPLVVESVTKNSIRFQEGEEINYDLLIGVPPAEGTNLAKTLPFSSKSGWLTVDRNTLNPLDYSEVFVIGDATDFSGIKTIASTVTQADVVSNRIMEEISGGEAKTKYDGFVSCFIITGLGKAVISTYNYDTRLPYSPPSEFLWNFAFGFHKIYWDYIALSSP